MKSIINKMLPAFIAMTCIAGAASAQELRTDVSVGSQFKENKVPGMVYNTQPAAKSNVVKPHTSTIEQMKNEGMPNVPMAKGGGSVSHSAKAAPQPPVPMASDAKAAAPAAKQAEVKMPEMQGGTQPKEAEIKQPAKVTVPSQEGVVKAAE
jgi:hypothetical protein